MFNLTPFSTALADKEFASICDIFSEWQQQNYIAFPKNLQSVKYQNPVNPENSVFKLAQGQSVFTWMRLNPEAAAVISTAMKVTRAIRGSLVDVYPTETLIRGYDSGLKILVDVGGSIGHDSAAFLAKHTEAKGWIVVQDMALVLEGATLLDPGIEKMPHDFFQP